MRRSCLLLTLCASLSACGDDAADPDAARPIDAAPIDAVDAAPGPDANPLMPATLAETGLCADPGCATINPGIRAYTPSFLLWSDGATKRRWIQLPDGAQIDTADMDYWQFPEGTKLWKEFTRDGTRVETRLLQKTGPDPDDWYMVAFAWNAAQTEAVAEPFGVVDALGTEHDIPGRSDCRKCHDRLVSRALGFGALQLDHAPATGELALAELASADLITVDPVGTVAPFFPLPGDATAQAAIGYLHANCGGCHNPTTDINTVAIDLRLRVGALASIQATPIYTTTVGVAPMLTLTGATSIIEPTMPAASAVHIRMTSTNDAQKMPPIARELVDTDGAAAVAAWIAVLPAP